MHTPLEYSVTVKPAEAFNEYKRYKNNLLNYLKCNTPRRASAQVQSIETLQMYKTLHSLDTQALLSPTKIHNWLSVFICDYLKFLKYAARTTLNEQEVEHLSKNYLTPAHCLLKNFITTHAQAIKNHTCEQVIEFFLSIENKKIDTINEIHSTYLSTIKDVKSLTPQNPKANKEITPALLPHFSDLGQTMDLYFSQVPVLQNLSKKFTILDKSQNPAHDILQMKLSQEERSWLKLAQSNFKRPIRPLRKLLAPISKNIHFSFLSSPLSYNAFTDGLLDYYLMNHVQKLTLDYKEVRLSWVEYVKSYCIKDKDPCVIKHLPPVLLEQIYESEIDKWNLVVICLSQIVDTEYKSIYNLKSYSSLLISGYQTLHALQKINVMQYLYQGLVKLQDPATLELLFSESNKISSYFDKTLTGGFQNKEGAYKFILNCAQNINNSQIPNSKINSQVLISQIEHDLLTNFSPTIDDNAKAKEALRDKKILKI